MELYCGLLSLTKIDGMPCLTKRLFRILITELMWWLLAFELPCNVKSSQEGCADHRLSGVDVSWHTQNNSLLVVPPVSSGQATRQM